jgi:signal peptidase I
MKILYEFWSWIRSIGIAFIIAFCISIFVFQPFKVSGHSMDPTLHNKEFLFVSKFSHTFSYLPNYLDVVIIDSRVDRKRSFKDDILEFPLLQFFRSNMDHTFFVKRVIGKPGDILEFKDHKVYRNGVALQEPYIKETMNYFSNKKWVVPSQHVFVMGDNRNNSMDSRNIGFVPLDHVLGKKLP